MGRAKGRTSGTTDPFAVVVGARRGLNKTDSVQAAKLETLIAEPNAAWAAMLDPDPAVARAALDAHTQVCAQDPDSSRRLSTWALLPSLPPHHNLENTLANHLADDFGRTNAWDAMRALAGCEIRGRPVNADLRQAAVAALVDGVYGATATDVADEISDLTSTLSDTSLLRQELLTNPTFREKLTSDYFGQDKDDPHYVHKNKLWQDALDLSTTDNLSSTLLNRLLEQSTNPELEAGANDCLRKLSALLPDAENYTLEQMLYYPESLAALQQPPAGFEDGAEFLLAAISDNKLSERFNHNLLTNRKDTLGEGADLDELGLMALRNLAQDPRGNYTPRIRGLSDTDKARPETDALITASVASFADDLNGNLANTAKNISLPVKLSISPGLQQEIATEMKQYLLQKEAPLKEMAWRGKLRDELASQTAAAVSSEEAYKQLLGENRYKRVHGDAFLLFGKLSEKVTSEQLTTAIRAGYDNDYNPYGPVGSIGAFSTEAVCDSLSNQLRRDK